MVGRKLKVAKKAGGRVIDALTTLPTLILLASILAAELLLAVINGIVIWVLTGDWEPFGSKAFLIHYFATHFEGFSGFWGE